MNFSKISWSRNIFLVIISIIISLVFLEVGLRIANSEYRFVDYRVVPPGSRPITKTPQKSSLGKYDPQLGWIPNPGYKSETINILDNGTRSNGLKNISRSNENNKTILVVGDSFAFGDDVEDHESWPAYLERKSGHKVINGGVGGYGLDQIFIRAKVLSKTFKPDLLIFSFYTDDIIRCGLSHRDYHKPFFSLEGGQLALRNTPVPQGELKTHKDFRFIDIMARSLLVHRLMIGLNDNWLESQNYLYRTKTNQDPEKISSAILNDALLYFLKENIKVVFVIQYTNLDIDTLKMVDRVTSGLKDEGGFLIDTRNELSSLMNNDFDNYKSLFFTVEPRGELILCHMTPKGNDFISKIIMKGISGFLE